MALRHVVMFRFAEGTTDDQVQALADGLDRMPAAVGTTVDYRHGRDAGISETSYDYVVVGDFASVDDYLAYRDHPDHQGAHPRPGAADPGRAGSGPVRVARLSGGRGRVLPGSCR
jgi:hypothetical protein